jgi:hypothetical protein
VGRVGDAVGVFGTNLLKSTNSNAFRYGSSLVTVAKFEKTSVEPCKIAIFYHNLALLPRFSVRFSNHWSKKGEFW